jgi:hypothetical protein
LVANKNGFERLALIHVKIVCANTGQIDLSLLKTVRVFRGVPLHITLLGCSNSQNFLTSQTQNKE